MLLWHTATSALSRPIYCCSLPFHQGVFFPPSPSIQMSESLVIRGFNTEVCACVSGDLALWRKEARELHLIPVCGSKITGSALAVRDKSQPITFVNTLTLLCALRSLKSPQCLILQKSLKRRLVFHSQARGEDSSRADRGGHRRPVTKLKGTR